jgi:hypothetical protein
VGFWYESGSLVLPSDTMRTLNKQLTSDEIEVIKQVSRNEVEQAFSQLRITVTEAPTAFWRVKVVQSLPARNGQPLPNAGESLALGILGGTGAIGFDFVAREALHYAPAGASRRTMVEGIGRGIGRVAVHEFMHQILGAAGGHNDVDEDSYEYGSPERSSQYYGQLHWTTAWPLLLGKFGV